MKKKILLWVILLLPYLGMLIVWQIHKREIAKIENASFILISKEEMALSVYNYKGQNIAKFPVACGKSTGNKEKVGDMKTPEGVFRISDIQDAANWSHDFGDGKGNITGAYGPYFIRLLTPGHTGIGIHGTHDNNSIGTRATEGCIRLQNENVLKLVELIHVGTIVIITPSADDVVVKEKKEEEKKEKVKKVKTNNHTTEYIVQSGDNLGKIANKFSVSVENIKSWNNLKSDNISIGQKLIIKVEG